MPAPTIKEKNTDIVQPVDRVVALGLPIYCTILGTKTLRGNCFSQWRRMVQVVKGGSHSCPIMVS